MLEDAVEAVAVDAVGNEQVLQKKTTMIRVMAVSSAERRGTSLEIARKNSKERISRGATILNLARGRPDSPTKIHKSWGHDESAVVVYDNINFKDTVRDEKLGRKAVMRALTTAAIVQSHCIPTTGLKQSMFQPRLSALSLDTILDSPAVSKIGSPFWQRAITKGFHASNDVKVIHRHLPREIGELLIWYLWLVGPLNCQVSSGKPIDNTLYRMEKYVRDRKEPKRRTWYITKSKTSITPGPTYDLCARSRWTNVQTELWICKLASHHRVRALFLSILRSRQGRQFSLAFHLLLLGRKFCAPFAFVFFPGSRQCFLLLFLDIFHPGFHVRRRL